MNPGPANLQRFESAVMLPTSTGSLLFGMILVAASFLQAQDPGEDPLDELWQLQYRAAELAAGGDEDGDGYTNYEESLAGTDPRDESSFPQLESRIGSSGPRHLDLSFDTRLGKAYDLYCSDNLQDFEFLLGGWSGDGSPRTLTLDIDSLEATTKSVHLEFWANVTGTLNDLVSQAAFPDTPDGTLESSRLAAPSFKATGYGSRMSFVIAAPESGIYTFFLSSGGEAELHLSSNEQPEGISKIAEISSSQDGLQPGDWTLFDSQRSAPATLTAGENYYMEVRYLGEVPNQHVEIGWKKPSTEGIEKLNATHLAGHVLQSASGVGSNAPRMFFKLGVTDQDQDGDTLLDSQELALAEHHDFLFFDASTKGTANDADAMAALMAAASSPPTFALYATDAAAFENNFPSQGDDHGEIKIIRHGSLAPVDVFLCVAPLASTGSVATVCDGTCCTLAGSVGDEAAEPADFRIYDEDGTLVTETVSFALGEIEKTLTVVAVEDTTYEYPETLNIALEASTDGSYQIQASPIGETLVLDETNYSSLENQATTETNGSGYEGSSYFRFDRLHSSVIWQGVTLGSAVSTLSISYAARLDRACEILVDGVVVGSTALETTGTDWFTFVEKSIDVDPISAGTHTIEIRSTMDVGGPHVDGISFVATGGSNGASIQLFDRPNHPDNRIFFTGVFSQDQRATNDTNGSGFAVATINGTRTEMKIWSQYSNLNEHMVNGEEMNPQINSHVHKAGAGNSAGDIVYPVTETPGDPGSSPFDYQLRYYPERISSISTSNGESAGGGYPWDLTESSGAIPTLGGPASKQVLIDSLFGQGGETPLYFNVHTVSNPGGEIWAFLSQTEALTTDPGDAAPPAPAGSEGFPRLYGNLLETEVRRFLNQATFGATNDQVDDLLDKISSERASDPTYHRYEAFSEWIDTQMDPLLTEQTYYFDYYMASILQAYEFAGLYDPTVGGNIERWGQPIRPLSYPSTNRSNPNPELWYIDRVYPLTYNEFRVGWDARLYPLHKRGQYQERRITSWQLMSNSHDQLRKKMGYALQQIVVVSNIETETREFGFMNYQDMLDAHAFGHYRDVLGFVNWNPIMAIYLSSLKNQKAIDFDGDGEFDSYPDENLARENMQLFSIGLFKRWSDGSLILDEDGLPQPTYTNDDIREFAKVITGQSFSRKDDRIWGGVEIVPEDVDFTEGSEGILDDSLLYRLKMFGEYHSEGPKTFAGVTIDNTHLGDMDAVGTADMEDAIDWLAGKPGDGLPDYDMVNSHISTPAFISKLLIQRFTTSNPSRGYLHRVATTFKNSEGHLGETLKAILLDPEARTIDLENNHFGMKKSPLEGFLQLMRGSKARSRIPLIDPEGAAPYDLTFSNQDFFLSTFGYAPTQLDNHVRNSRIFLHSTSSNGANGLQMGPLEQPTVFNFYQSDFSPSSVFSQSGLVAPELQILNEPDVIRNINFFELLIRSTIQGFPLGGDNARQMAYFGSNVNHMDNLFSDTDTLSETYYPPVEPVVGLSSEVTIPNHTGDYWMRVERKGDQFTTSKSPDGVTWDVIDIQNIPMGSDVHAGLVVSSNQSGVSSTSVFDNVAIGGNASTGWITRVSGSGASSVSESNGIHTIAYAGAGIGGTEDDLIFRGVFLSGDATVTARVVSSGTAVTAQAGVTVREFSNSNSNHITCFTTPNGEIASQFRNHLAGRSVESLADQELLDALDRTYCNGYFRLRYPYDPSDDGAGGEFMNPREAILDHLTHSFDDPFDGVNDATDRRSKYEDALYLLTSSAEFQVRK